MTAYNSCGCQSLTSCEPDMFQYCCWTMKEAAHHQHTMNCSSSIQSFKIIFKKTNHKVLSLENMNKVHLNGHKTIWALLSTLAFKYDETISTQCLELGMGLQEKSSHAQISSIFFWRAGSCLCVSIDRIIMRCCQVISAIIFRKGHFLTSLFSTQLEMPSSD